MLTSQINGKPVYIAKTSRKGETSYKKVGKVHLAVFSPDGKTVLGYQVQRPDLAMMIKREDLFVAFDSLKPYDKGYVIDGEAACDKEARERLNIDWDHCLLWNGMDAVTTQGKVLGFVGNVAYDAETGRVISFHIGDGNVAKGLVGAIKIPVGMFVGYEGGKMLLAPEAADVQPSGGLAGKAGESYARAKMKAGEASAKAAAKASAKASEVSAKASAKASEVGAKAGEAVQKGSYGLGKTLGKTKGMFKAFKDEFDEASK